MLAAALELLARGAGVLPLPWVRSLGRGLGLLAWALGIRRAHVVASMARAGVAAPHRTARAMYRALGISVFELLWTRGRAGPVAPLVRLTGEARDALAGARAKGRGVVLAASHTGNWEIAAARLAEEMPLVAVTKELRVRGFDGFATRARARRGVRTVYAGEVVARAGAVLGGNEALALVIDQVPMFRRHGVVCEFLGAPAWVDRAPAALAARAGAPLVVTAARREPDGTHSLHVLAVHEPPAGADRAWSSWATAEATRALDRFVRENPSEWLWLHRRWRAPAS